MLPDKKSSPPTRYKLIDILSTTNINTSVAQSLWYRSKYEMLLLRFPNYLNQLQLPRLGRQKKIVLFQ